MLFVCLWCLFVVVVVVLHLSNIQFFFGAKFFFCREEEIYDGIFFSLQNSADLENWPTEFPMSYSIGKTVGIRQNVICNELIFDGRLSVAISVGDWIFRQNCSIFPSKIPSQIPSIFLAYLARKVQAQVSLVEVWPISLIAIDFVVVRRF